MGRLYSNTMWGEVTVESMWDDCTAILCEVTVTLDQSQCGRTVQ